MNGEREYKIVNLIFREEIEEECGIIKNEKFRIRKNNI